MRISYDPAVWLCLLGGVALILTGFTAKAMLHGTHMIAGPDTRHSNAQISGQRALLVVLGLLVIAYSAGRILYFY